MLISYSLDSCIISDGTLHGALQGSGSRFHAQNFLKIWCFDRLYYKLERNERRARANRTAARQINMDKTNALRLLDQKKIPYQAVEYDPETAVGGVEVAEGLKEDPNLVYKTLVTVGKSGEHYVFVIPSPHALDLKKAAKWVGEKSIAMIPQKDLLPLTGYVHGGCSPVGMKKFFRTTLDQTATALDIIYMSGGRRGLQIAIAPKDLEKVIRLRYADVITTEE